MRSGFPFAFSTSFSKGWAVITFPVVIVVISTILALTRWWAISPSSVFPDPGGLWKNGVGIVAVVLVFGEFLLSQLGSPVSPV